MFKLFGKSEKEKEVGVPKAAAVQPIPAARKSVLGPAGLPANKKPEKASPVLANRSSAPGPGKELVRSSRGEVGDKDFLLAEMQALLDPCQSGRVKGEELRHILASIGNRWNKTIFWKQVGSCSLSNAGVTIR